MELREGERSGFVIRVWIIMEIFGAIEIIDQKMKIWGRDGGDVATREMAGNLYLISFHRYLSISWVNSRLKECP